VRTSIEAPAPASVDFSIDGKNTNVSLPFKRMVSRVDSLHARIAAAVTVIVTRWSSSRRSHDEAPIFRSIFKRTLNGRAATGHPAGMVRILLLEQSSRNESPVRGQTPAAILEKNMRFNLALLSLGILVCGSTAQAGAPQPFSDDLFFDWDGLRSELREDGIDLRVGYTSETATNVRGGDKDLWRYADQWTFAATLDLHKLLEIDHAQFKIAVIDRNGRNLSADANLDDLQQVQEIYGDKETWYLTQFWYDQKYLDGMLDWKVGRLSEGEDFAAFSCEFMNFTFCGAAPGNGVGSYWYNWPVSQWGTRVKVSVPGFGYVQLGAFEVNPSYLMTRYSLDLGDPPGATGMLAPVEIGWLPTIGRGLDGSYKLGAWYNSSRVPDVVDNTNGLPLAIAGGEPLMRHGEYGGYFNFLQRLTAPLTGASKQGVSVFLNGIYADRRTSTLDSQMAAGVLYTGPIASLREDELGFAIGRTHVNSRVADVEWLQNELGRGPVGVQSAEYVGELFYKIQATRWLDLRPNIQYVRQPGGISNKTSDVVIGLKLSVNL